MRLCRAGYPSRTFSAKPTPLDSATCKERPGYTACRRYRPFASQRTALALYDASMDVIEPVTLRQPIDEGLSGFGK
jgi:hypothetical protein